MEKVCIKSENKIMTTVTEYSTQVSDIPVESCYAVPF